MFNPISWALSINNSINWSNEGARNKRKKIKNGNFFLQTQSKVPKSYFGESEKIKKKRKNFLFPLFLFLFVASKTIMNPTPTIHCIRTSNANQIVFNPKDVFIFWTGIYLIDEFWNWCLTTITRIFFYLCIRWDSLNRIHPSIFLNNVQDDIG